jgi:hypothetical protein
VVTPDAPPAFELTLQRYDQATGQTVQQAAGATGWASLVTLNIRRDTGASSAADTYELIGAGESDIMVLERLLEAIGDSDASLAGLAVLYPSGAKASPGLVSDDFAHVRTGLIQSNLTTVTLPPSGANVAAKLLGDPPAPWSTVYNPTIAQFLRFVWEASITRSGGFYLYYYDTDRQAGLPDAMFNDQGEGRVNLLVVHRDPAAVPSYVNCALLGQGIRRQGPRGHGEGDAAAGCDLARRFAGRDRPARLPARLLGRRATRGAAPGGRQAAHGCRRHLPGDGRATRWRSERNCQVVRHHAHCTAGGQSRCAGGLVEQGVPCSPPCGCRRSP